MNYTNSMATASRMLAMTTAVSKSETTIRSPIQSEEARAEMMFPREHCYGGDDVHQYPNDHHLVFAGHFHSHCDCSHSSILENQVIHQAKELTVLRQVLERLQATVFQCSTTGTQNDSLQPKVHKHRKGSSKIAFGCETLMENNLVHELGRIRELLACALVKVRQLEEGRKRGKDDGDRKKSKARTKVSSKSQCGLETIDENSAPTDFVTDKEYQKANFSLSNEASLISKEQVESLKKQWLEIEKEWEKEHLCLLEEINQRQLELEDQEVELKLLNAERIRLASQEEKMKEALRILRHLKLLNFPRRTLGKIIIDSLAGCRDQNIPELHVQNFLDLFHRNLLDCEMLHNYSLVPLALKIDTSLADD